MFRGDRMGAFSLFVLIPIIAICALLGAICLKIAKQSVNVLSVTIFTAVGGVIGVLTIIGWVLIFSTGGQLNSFGSVLGMFIVAGILAVAGGTYATSVYSKHNKQRQHRPSGWTR